MNILLCGYNWAGCRALDLLINQGHNVHVFTHESPDYIPSLFNYAQHRGISVSLKSINSAKLPFKPDILCSIYYRKIIKKHILELVDNKAFNLHPSLLPSYRGCSSLTWAMINGEKEVGFTYHYMDEDCDAGKVILQKKLKTFHFDNQNNLYQRLMYEALKKFEEALDLVNQGYQGKKQNGKATYYPRVVPESGEIKDTWSTDKIKRFINAMICPPLPYARYRGFEVKSYEQYLKIKNENRN
jgi:methionyl-tRNA formyltransferase